MHDVPSRQRSSLTTEKAAYFRWRDNLSAYDNFDSYIDEDQQLRRKLRITATDEIEWRNLRGSHFQIEF